MFDGPSFRASFSLDIPSDLPSHIRVATSYDELACELGLHSVVLDSKCLAMLATLESTLDLPSVDDIA